MTDPATSEAAEVLWTPDPDLARETAIADFARWVGEHRGVKLDELDYAALHEWSVGELDGFWSAAAEYLGVIFRDPPTATLGSRDMPGAQWFPGATLNYAEHALTPGPGRADGDVAIDFVREDGLTRTVTHAELRDAVGGPGPGWSRSAWVAGTGWSRWPRTAWKRWSCSWPQRRWGRSGRPARRTSGPARCTTGSPRSSRRCCWPWTVTATAASGSTSAAASPPFVGSCRPCTPPCWSATSTPGRAWTGPCRGRSSPRTPGRWSSSRCRSTIRCGCCTRRAPPGCPRASCTGTAGSCWST